MIYDVHVTREDIRDPVSRLYSPTKYMVAKKAMVRAIKRLVPTAEGVSMPLEAAVGGYLRVQGYFLCRRQSHSILILDSKAVREKLAAMEHDTNITSVPPFSFQVDITATIPDIPDIPF